MLFVIIGIALAVLGFVAYLINRMPDAPAKKKKEKRPPPPEPVKDWQGITERLEKKAQAIEAKLKAAEAVIRDKDKEINEHKAAIGGLERQFQQEQLWRKKEEDAVEKEKKREKMLETELDKTRDTLNSESTQKIKLEYEVRELRTLKESITADVRRLTSQNMDLDRKLKAVTDEDRELKRENAQLKVKKEADQWIAKDDFIRVEKLLKRARWEVELFKRKFAEDLWPRELQMKPKPSAKEAGEPETELRQQPSARSISSTPAVPAAPSPQSTPASVSVPTDAASTSAVDMRSALEEGQDKPSESTENKAA
jgi:hypothetical protein